MEEEAGTLEHVPNQCTQLGAKLPVGHLPREGDQVVAASTGNVGGQQGTEPILVLRHGLVLSPALSLPAGENKLCGRLKFGKHGKTDSSDCLPVRKRTSTSRQAEVCEPYWMAATLACRIIH